MAGYQDFIDYIRQSSDEDEKKRQAQAAAKAQAIKEAQDKQKNDKSPLDKALEFIGGAAKGVGDFAGGIVNNVKDDAVEAAKTVGEMATQAVDQATGTTDKLREAISNTSKQNFDDYNSGKINKSEFDDKQKAVAEAQKKLGGFNKDIQNRDKVKSAAATANTFLNVAGGLDGLVEQIPKLVGKKAAVDTGENAIKELPSALDTVKKNVATGAAFGSSQSALEDLRKQGDQANAGQVATDALTSGALGGVLGGVGSIFDKNVRTSASDAIKSGVNDFRLQPRSVREGGFIRVPGGEATDKIAGPDELASSVVPGATKNPLDVTEKLPETPQVQHPQSTVIDDRLKPANDPQAVTPGDIKPTDVNEGVTYKSREQIMKDNKVQRPFWQKFNEQMFDSNAPLKDLSKAYTKATGKVLDAENDPHALAQLRNGMDEAAAARLQDIVSDFDYVRKNNLSEDVKQFGIAQQVTNDRADVYGPETVNAESKKIEDMQKRLGPEKFQQVQAATQRVIDFQDDQLSRLKDAGFVSDEAYKAIKEFNPHYFTRFNLADYIDSNQKMFASTNSNNISKNLVQAVKGVGDDRKFVIEDPFEAVTRAAMKTENIIQQNKIFKSAQAISDVAPDMVVKLRNESDVTARMSLASDNKELRPVKAQLDRIIKGDSRTVGKLQTEMNNLEKKGLNVQLKGGGQRMSAADYTTSGLGGDVATSQTGKVSRTAGDEMTDLSRQVEGAINRRNAPGATDAVKTRAQGVVNEGIVEGAGTQATTTGSKMGSQDTASFVRNLIENGSRADIDRIKRQIGSRDVKVNQLLDDIGYAKSQYDEVAGKIKDNSNEAAAHTDADVPEGYEAVSGWNKGVQERIALPQYIADAYKGKNDIQTGALEKIFNATSKPFKAAATVLSPAFLVKNSIRDTGTHWLTSENIPASERLLLVPYAKRWVQGFMDSLTDSDFAKKITESGGGAAGIFNDKGSTEKIVRDVASKITGEEIKTPQNMFKTAAKIVGKYTGIAPVAKAYNKGVTAAGRALEYAPRLAEARAAIEKGMSDPAAALAARNALGDLQNGGTVSRLLNNYTPFFNSIVQGNKRVVDAIGKDPKKMVGMLAAGVALPAVSGYVWNRTMYPDVLNNLSETDRENNFVIILGDHKDKDGRYTDVIKIPKNDAAKVFGNNIEVAMDKFAGQDSQGFAELFMKTLGYAQPVQLEKNGNLSLDAILGTAPIVSSPLARVPIETATNHSFFTGRDIIPQSKEGLSAEQQIGKNTSPIDAALAKVSGISPYQIQNARQGVSASLLNGKNPVDQVGNVVAGSNGNRATTEFYKITDKVSANKASVNKYINDAIARGDTADAQAAAQSYNAYLVKQFTPFAQKYGDQMTQDLSDTYDSLKLNLTTRSVKQRQKTLQANANQ